MPPWVQTLIYVLIVLGPVLIKMLNALSKRVQAHAEKRRREIERERAEIEALRTGRPVTTASQGMAQPETIGQGPTVQPRAQRPQPAAAQAKSAQEALEEIAQRRAKRAEELARRRAQAGAKTGPRTSQPPVVGRQPQPVPRQPQPAPRQRADQRIERQQLEQGDRVAQPMSPRRVAAAFTGIPGSEDDEPIRTSVKSPTESDAAYATRPRFDSARQRARFAPTGRQELRRAMVLNEVLARPVALRDEPVGF